MLDFVSRSGTVLLALALAACGAKPPPRVLWSVASPALDAHATSRDSLRSLRAEARVDQRDGTNRVRGTILMYLERPDHVRFDAMTQLGPAAILTSDGETLALTDLREQSFLTGPPCPGNIARLLGIALSAQEIAPILFGQAPRIRARSEEVRWENGAYLFELRGEDGTRQRLRFEVDARDQDAVPERQRLRLIGSELHSSSGELLYRVEWSDFELIGGLAFATRIHFVSPARNLDTILHFEHIEPNVAVPEGAFVQVARPGLIVTEATCEP